MARRVRVSSSTLVVEFTDIDEEQLWAPGHLIYDWCARITLELEKQAKQTAPGIPGTSMARWRGRKGTGRLRASIVALGTRTGPESYTLTLTSQAPYSLYVLRGTAFGGVKFIYSRAGFANRAFIDANIHTWHEGELIQSGPNAGNPSGEGKFGILPISGNMFMVLPPGAGHSRRFHLRVRGQLPNAYLHRAWERTNEIHHNQLGGLVDFPLGFTRVPGAQRLGNR
jgi:hypothetical protein